MRAKSLLAALGLGVLMAMAVPGLTPAADAHLPDPAEAERLLDAYRALRVQAYLSCSRSTADDHAAWLRCFADEVDRLVAGANDPAILAVHDALTRITQSRPVGAARSAD